MATLKTCRRCSRFQGITRYRPNSIGVLYDGITSGWYVRCGDDEGHTNISIPDALGIEGMPCESYQVFTKFLRLNANRGVECPRGRESRQNQGKMEQMALL